MTIEFGRTGVGNEEKRKELGKVHRHANRQSQKERALGDSVNRKMTVK